MYKYFLPLVVSLVILSQTNWIEGNVIGVAPDSPNNNNSNLIVQINLPGTDPNENVPYEWHTVDVSGHVPPGTKAIFLNTMFAITHGVEVENCFIILHIRRTGTNPERSIVAKSVSSEGRERDNYTDWIALQDGKFDFMWEKYPADTGGDYPDHCAMGLAMLISAYLR